MQQLKQNLTPQQALLKAKHYCSYQERCHCEVKEKLYGLGLNKSETEQIMSTLIEGNYLNEERFAIQFAGGHFRTKNWGRVKIAHALKQKQVSPYCIKTALLLIDKKEYKKTLQKLLDLKLKSLKTEKNIFNKKQKLQVHLLQKGFEMDLVKEMIASIKLS